MLNFDIKINLDEFYYAPGDDSPHGGILLLLCPYVCMYVCMYVRVWLKFLVKVLFWFKL